MDKPLTLHPHELISALAGTLTQVRRPVVPQPVCFTNGDTVFSWATFGFHGHVHTWDRNGIGGENWNADEHPGENKFTEALRRTPYKNACPLGRPGDVIWGKETWGVVAPGCSTPGGQPYDPWVVYRIDDPDYKPSMPQWEPFRWRSPITMPRWASRWASPVAAVRVERAQDMTREDAIAMGCPDEATAVLDGMSSRIEWAMYAWDRHYAAKGYPFEANPWVWVAEIGGVK